MSVQNNIQMANIKAVLLPISFSLSVFFDVSLYTSFGHNWFNKTLWGVVALLILTFQVYCRLQWTNTRTRKVKYNQFFFLYLAITLMTITSSILFGVRDISLLVQKNKHSAIEAEALADKINFMKKKLSGHSGSVEIQVEALKQNMRHSSNAWTTLALNKEIERLRSQVKPEIEAEELLAMEKELATLRAKSSTVRDNFSELASFFPESWGITETRIMIVFLFFAILLIQLSLFVGADRIRNFTQIFKRPKRMSRKEKEIVSGQQTLF